MKSKQNKYIDWSLRLLVSLLFCAFGLSSCALDSMAGGVLADSLSKPGSNTVFTGDDDPILVGDALPFAIKMYETVLAMKPEHDGMLQMVGSLYVMYANVYVALPASMLTDEHFDEKSAAIKRAKLLYLRGTTFLFRSLEHRHPGFKAAFDKGDLATVLVKCTKEDVASLYWAGAGWFGAMSLDILDASLGLRITQAKEMMDRAYQLDPDFNQGALDDFFVMYYASMPEGMGRDLAKAEKHFKESLRKSKGLRAGPWLAWAESTALPAQKRQEFDELLDKALAVDAHADPDGVLVNTIMQNKARYYKGQLDTLFWQ